MLLQLHAVLDADELARARALLAGASWGDGRVTSGVQSALAKNNEQLPQERRGGEGAAADRPGGAEPAPRCSSRRRCRGGSCRRSSTATRARQRVRRPRRQRHPVRSAAAAERVRTDISCTLFLAEPDEYDGGELVIEDTFGAQRVKLPAGDMVLYPGTSVHRVEPVTRGARVASFFWVESMVRSDEQRRLLFEMDNHLMRLRAGRRNRSRGDRPDRHVSQPAAPLGRRLSAARAFRTALSAGAADQAAQRRTKSRSIAASMTSPHRL